MKLMILKKLSIKRRPKAFEQFLNLDKLGKAFRKNISTKTLKRF
jgi:hypothetical protein